MKNTVGISQNRQNNIVFAGLITILVFIVAIVVIFSLPTARKSGEQNLGTYSLTFLEARLASANNALSGDGNLTDKTCDDLFKLAGEYDKNADFVSCSWPTRLYLATPDTANTKVLTVSDSSHTAIFTTDSKIKKLLNYKFIDKASAGFNNFDGRE